MKYIPLVILLLNLLIISCVSKENPQEYTPKEIKATPIDIVKLDLRQAQNLITMPLNCIDVEYPNKLGQTIASKSDIKTPSELHPVFYGCFDWHSAVHGHWSIVYLLKNFPDLENYDDILQQLQNTMSADNMRKEAAYFDQKHNKSYERTYGWAWLLKLSEELYTWDHPIAKEILKNMEPLESKIIEGYLSYLPKLNYPVRVGTHTNTAFGLSFAYDYASTTGNETLKTMIAKRAKDFYLNDTGCPIAWEPSGQDFLSPCLEEIDIMRRVLSADKFSLWVNNFMPELAEPSFSLAPGIVSDRTDGQLVHLDGVNFSRAWCLYGIANVSPTYSHLRTIANEHVSHSIDEVVGDDYEGGHWLGSFAIYALHSQK